MYREMYINAVRRIHCTGYGRLDNTMYMCGGLGESFQDTTMVLNRLVDPEMVKCIRVNGTKCLPEE